MSAQLIALVVGTLLAVGALAFVVAPLFLGANERPVARVPRGTAAADSAIRALREIEFDRATGKLSDSDYTELRRTYGDRALREMRDATKPASMTDPIEARVREFRMTHRECVTCGLRPEADAIYCSTCGGYLDGACSACAARVTEAGAAHCSTCGTSLTAHAGK